ncbi:MAG: BREX-1 system adenine-specific DNA-methyltransferase PglX [Bacteroidales bacterium]|nr:BREX-1 system adenine-specific DNA-methyltransferase PglX [Bacteroidales bacterium]
MNTSSLKKFAIAAREKLIKGVGDKILALGFDKKGNVQEKDFPQRIQGGTIFMGQPLNDEGFYEMWMSLYERVQQIGIKEVIEEAAYTWFNRLMAVKIMQENGWIDKVLDFESEDVRVPMLVANARRGMFPRMSAARENMLRDLLEYDMKTTEQFNMLITDYCKNVPVINKCFGKISDYTELLLPKDALAAGGIVDLINHTEFISEDDFKQSELIGWLYQFYISEKKDQVFASFKDKKKAEAEDIPAATQIFTPNWIVKYMVQNTVGRIYLDNNPYADEIKDKMKYLVEKEEGGEILRIDSVEDMKVADLACGSGHILNEAFDLLYDMYLDEGYGRRQAIENIFKKNLLGIDLDTRAKQLAMFALLMKACSKDDSFLDAKVLPRVYAMPDPYKENGVDLRDFLAHFYLGGNRKTIDETIDAIKLMDQAKNLGSIMKFELSDSTRAALQIRVDEWKAEESLGGDIREFLKYADIILALTDKYHALVMNPPYMGSGNMNPELNKYVKDNYEDTKADLFSVFMDVAIERLIAKGKYGMINMQSWMFLSSFENLRKKILKDQTIDNMLHLGPHTFDELAGEVVQNIAYVITKVSGEDRYGVYYRLVSGKSCEEKHILYLDALNGNSEISFNHICQDNFNKIPGCVLGYWLSSTLLNCFSSLPKLNDVGITRLGMTTGENARFVRQWFELDINVCEFNATSQEDLDNTNAYYVPYNKGGGFRRWYGNNDCMLFWKDNGYAIKNFADANGRIRSTVPNTEYYYLPCASWSKISTGKIAFRYKEHSIFDVAGACYFPMKYSLSYMLGLLNTTVVNNILSSIAPTVNFEGGQIASLPVPNANDIEKIEILSDNNVSISKQDWDAHETSWDFQDNELIALQKEGLGTITAGWGDTEMMKYSDLGLLYLEYETKWREKFNLLHANEEELNRQFIEIYGLQDELTPEVPLNEITILQQGEIKIENGEIVFQKDEVIRQFVSYLVGLIMGRYRLDKPGLNIAHPNPTEDELSSYEYNDSTVEIDGDGIMPLMSGECSFSDNALKRITELVRVIFGNDNHATNMAFINDALGKSLEDYLVKDFYADHLKKYQKRPIYWLFSSKKGAFKVLAYMHRMDRYTAEMIRNKYLLPHIENQRVMIADLESRASVLTTAERKKLERLRKEHEECLEYHERLHAVADEQIGFDLDDGVVVNYAKFGDVLAKLK